MHFERQFCLSKCIKIYFFLKIPDFFLGFTSKFRYGQVTLNTGIFLFGLNLSVEFIHELSNHRPAVPNCLPQKP